MEKRKDFYADEINYDRMNKVLNYVIENLTLKEILKMIREISYDMVSYYNERDCSIIYKSDKYSKESIYQANQLQRSLRDLCDLFGQSIINTREFDNNYLNKFINGGSMELEIENLRQEIKKLNLEIERLVERNGL